MSASNKCSGSLLKVDSRGRETDDVEISSADSQVIFRGFLLPSLAKYMPMAASILVSSVLFAGAHCSTQRFLPLCLLGVVFGTLYAESHNLLAAVTAHSLWNCFVFLSFLVDPSPPLFPV